MAASWEDVVTLVQKARAGRPSPFLISVSGGVASGKSWTANLLRERLAAPPDALRVSVVGSDGFLYPNTELELRGLSARKGFPETYDVAALQRFIDAVRAGEPDASAPVYSHTVYDIVTGARQPVGRPDVLIMEGLALLSDAAVAAAFDLSIYLDADEGWIEAWFTRRFLELVRAAADDPSSFSHPFTGLSPEQVTDMAHAVWDAINVVNLREHILPGRALARVVVEKGPDHEVRAVKIRD